MCSGFSEHVKELGRRTSGSRDGPHLGLLEGIFTRPLKQPQARLEDLLKLRSLRPTSPGAGAISAGQRPRVCVAGELLPRSCCGPGATL